MNLNQFYLLLFGLSLFGALSFLLLIEVVKLRHFLNGLQSEALEAKRRICWLTSESELRKRRTEDLQAIASVHWEAFTDIAERLKRIESVPFVVVRMASEVAGEPGEVHPFAADAFVTIGPGGAGQGCRPDSDSVAVGSNGNAAAAA